MTDRQLAMRLPRAWDPFFSRFGSLTEAQRKVIPSILSGEDVLLCAPTASGKTEAACAPLVERHMHGGRPWTILYVSPTRALVNDLYARLASPLELLKLRVTRRTGEHREQTDQPPHVLITTPESLDSMLCRGKREGGHLLANVVAVVLDEIHLLHGSARGEQVRWLLRRLRRLREFGERNGWCWSSDIQVVGLSATVAAPESVRDSYLPGGRIESVSGGRTIEVVAEESRCRSTEEALCEYLRECKVPEKVLVFTNSRARTDTLSHTLQGRLEELRYDVAAHHGSLVQQVREEAEHAAKTSDAIVLVATSTLEIGVDIGDIDLVVLDAPPPDVPAFLQRIGRGNRRSNRTRVMLCAANPGEEIQQRALLYAARRGSLEGAERGVNYAVARQQLASFIFQAPVRPRRQVTQVTAFLEECWLSQACNVSQFIAESAAVGDVTREGEKLALGDGWLEMTKLGAIHGTIESPGGKQVTDQKTGDGIAQGVRLSGGRRMQIAGKDLRVAKVGTHVIEVRQGSAPGDDPAKWSYASSPFLESSARARAVRSYLDVDQTIWPAITASNGLVVFHFGGAVRQAVLELIALQSRQPLSANGWYLRPSGQELVKPGWLTDTGPKTLDVLIGQGIDRLERTLGRPRANRLLPLPMRIEEVRHWLNLEEEVEAIRAATWEWAEPSVAQELTTLVAHL